LKKGKKPDFPNLAVLNEHITQAKFILDNFIPNIDYQITETLNYLELEFGD